MLLWWDILVLVVDIEIKDYVVDIFGIKLQDIIICWKKWNECGQN